MIESITVNRTHKDFFGHDRLDSDTLDYGITAERVCKAVTAVARGSAYSAHFKHSDGTSDSVWTEHGDVEAKVLTWRHFEGLHSRDADVKVTPKEFKAKMRAALLE